MKITFKFHQSLSMLMAVAFTIVAAGCKDEVVFTHEVKAVELVNGEETDPAIADADVYFYNTKNDFLAGAKPVVTGKTNGDGKYIYRDTEANTLKSYYVHVTKGALSSLRFGQKSISRGTEPRRTIVAPLSTTPTKLELQVFYNGTPIGFANVKLYLSEADYLADRTYQGTEPELKYYGSTWHPAVLSNATGPDGTMTLEKLEPRQYWFRVSKEIGGINRTNAGGVIKTAQALPDNPDNTTSFTVGLQ